LWQTLKNTTAEYLKNLDRKKEAILLGFKEKHHEIVAF
jgi:hypothetical protein